VTWAIPARPSLPGFRQLLLRACLAPENGMLAKRTWQAVMDQMVTHGKETTRAKCERAMKSRCFDRLRRTRILETGADDFLAVLNSCRCSVNHYLRRASQSRSGPRVALLPCPARPSSGPNPDSRRSAPSPARSTSRFWRPRRIRSGTCSTKSSGRSARNKAMLRNSGRIKSTGAHGSSRFNA
jgi:hypothetical protein